MTGPVLSEAALHRATAQFLAAALPPEVIWFHIPNGGHRNKIVAAKLKGMGVLRGVPDILICWLDSSTLQQTGWIELKSAKGRLSAEQNEFMKRADYLFHWNAVVRSLDELKATLKLWRVPLRASVLPMGAIIAKGTAA